MDQFCQRGDSPGFAVKSIPNQPSHVFTAERRKDDFVHDRARLADRFELADQRMGGIDLVIPTSPINIRCRTSGWVNKSSSRSSVAESSHCKSSRNSANGCSGRANAARKRRKNQPKAALRVMVRQLRDRRLVADDVLKLRNQVYDEPPVRA